MLTRSLFLLSIVSTASQASTFNCENEFEWLKETFANNDAGYSYIIEKKGNDSYQSHNQQTLIRVKQSNALTECHAVLRDWLSFFRSGHIGLHINHSPEPSNDNTTSSTTKIDINDFKKYVSEKSEENLEGIWNFSSYQIAVKKVGNSFHGIVTQSGNENWQPGQTKLIFTPNEKTEQFDVTYFMGDHSPREIKSVEHLHKNAILLDKGFATLERQNGRTETPGDIKRYVKLQAADGPHFERVSEHTNLIRIPSFNYKNKKAIDALIEKHKALILSTDNLIIDIRGNGGGSDSSYRQLIPFMYTNPIKTISVEMLSTPLNNARMDKLIAADFTTEGTKKWAKKAKKKLDKHLNQFVNIPGKYSTTHTLDNVSNYPKNVAILINDGNGSTAEQFLLAAKQSKKVKLFGTTTAGVLDISNMNRVESPSGQLRLHYALSRSLRIPEMAIDDKGIMPDYYLGKDIPVYEWIDQTKAILEAE